jgi:hypothetical protein
MKNSLQKTRKECEDPHRHDMTVAIGMAARLFVSTLASFIFCLNRRGKMDVFI